MSNTQFAILLVAVVVGQAAFGLFREAGKEAYWRVRRWYFTCPRCGYGCGKNRWSGCSMMVGPR